MTPEELEDLYRKESRKVHATLIRLLRDFDLAEEATQEAFAAALQSWSREGVPGNPVGWLVSTGRFKAVDLIRRETRFRELEPRISLLEEEIRQQNEALAELEVPDDRLRLIFTCCHPALDPKIQIPLTLREVCGLTTAEIARAYLTSPTAMAQRIVRGKAKIRHAGIPYVVPELGEVPERLDAVLRVIYLVFNEGYSASAGEHLLRSDLSGEAIRLGRLLLELLPDPEVKGLLALMLLHESRRLARTNPKGDIVLLEDQDRSLWDRDMIEEGDRLLTEVLAGRRFGSYTLQAAISGVHAAAETAEATDWAEIVGLYNLLVRVEPTPIVHLNRAVAVAMLRGPERGLELVDALLGDLNDYSLAHAARGQWLTQLGLQREAEAALVRALDLTQVESEKRLLRAKIENLKEIS